MDTLHTELRSALKSIRKDSRLAVIAILTLGLGIGSATAIFSAFYSLLYEPFPYKNSDRLVTFSLRSTSSAGSAAERSFYTRPEFEAFRAQTSLFEDLVGYDRARSVLYNDGQGTRAFPGGAYVSGNTFLFYGVPALVGRVATEDDARPGAPPVFIMNYRLWKTLFNGDTSIVGKTFTLDNQPRTLIGIMPPRFNVYDVSIWIPSGLDTIKDAVQIVGRLEPNISLGRAASDLNVLTHRLTKQEPGFVLNPEQYTIDVHRLMDDAVGGLEGPLRVLLGAVLLLLLLACLNTANLLLARATVRDRDFAIRSALGAGRARLLRHTFFECALLSTAACLSGCAMAQIVLHAAPKFVPPGMLPSEAVLQMNWRVLLFAVTAATLTTFICGFAPAFRSARADLHTVLMGGGRGVVSDRRGGLRNVFVVAQVTLSLVLLSGTTLLMRSFQAMTQVDYSFDPAHTLYVQLALPKARYYAQPDPKPAFFAKLLPKLDAIPGVSFATQSLMLPPQEGSWTDVAIPGKPHADRWVTDFEFCTANYFKTLGLQLRRGRLLSPEDVALGRYVAVVNQTLARRYFDTEDPIGKQIKFEVLDRPFIDGPHNTYFEIVGVVSDFLTHPSENGLTLRPEAFLPASTAGFGYPQHLLAHTSGDPHLVLAEVQRAVWSVDPSVAFGQSGAISDVLSERFQEPRFELAIFAAFGTLGLTLVALGIYSVMTYSVSLRTHEIGVRMAVGALPGSILRLVLNSGMLLTALGVVLGLLCSLALSRFLTSMLGRTSPRDPSALGLAIAVMLIAGACASALPAWRAASINPLETLRSE